MILGKLLNLPKPRFSHLENGVNNNLYLIGLVWGLDSIMWSAQLRINTYPINICSYYCYHSMTMSKLSNHSEAHLYNWNSYICLIKMGGTDVIMYLMDMIHSRFLWRELFHYFPKLAFMLESLHWLRAFRGQLHAFHSLPKLNHIPHWTDRVPEWILFQVSPCNPIPTQMGPT